MKISEYEADEILESLLNVRNALKNQLKVLDETINMMQSQYMTIKEYFGGDSEQYRLFRKRVDSECEKLCMENNIPIKTGALGKTTYPLSVLEKVCGIKDNP